METLKNLKIIDISKDASVLGILSKAWDNGFAIVFGINAAKNLVEGHILRY